MPDLNAQAARLARTALDQLERLRIVRVDCASGATLLDFGVQAAGGLAAGKLLAEICLAGLGEVAIVPGDAQIFPGPAISVFTDHPVAACMASQYAGWQIAGEKFFAMGSGPMRAAAGKEELFAHIGHQERPTAVVGVLESGKLPPSSVCEKIAADCGVAPAQLTLAVARTASIAGTVQVVARTVETALHKLHELGFDLQQVASGYGVSPLPPVAADDMIGIGRTNDAVLYGGRVTLWVRADDDLLAELGPKIPSCASADHGRPFAEIFKAYGYDFYKIDPHLFSPAEVTLVNLASGRTHRYGAPAPDILRAGFHGS
jgi:methenyltetrahydromethanopterin cyclohydrolase